MSRLFAMLFALALFAANLQMAAAADQCSILTSEDVQTITGVHVQNVPFNSKPGGGGKCANFTADNGRLFLGVSQLSSAAGYAAEVAAVPQAVYPERTKLTDVSDEAILMKGANGSLRYLVARKGERGVIMFPFGLQPTDDMLKQLAALALTR
jgi:hypothetical protein